MKEWKIDNALVGMKDKLYNRIYSTVSPAELSAILDELIRLAELWTELDYAYKGSELARSIRIAAVSLRLDLAPQAWRRSDILRCIEKRASDVEYSFRRLQQQKHENDMQDSLEKYRNECIIQI